MLSKLSQLYLALSSVAASEQLFLQKESDDSLIDKCVSLDPWLQASNIDINEQPVIGIVSQTIDFTPDKDDHRFDDYGSYIMAAYVRFVQGAGARVIPIIWDEPEEVTRDKLSKVNGVLFPGGAGDYMRVGQLIVEEAKKMNDGGDFFPLWGTCLGFERLAVFTASSEDVLEQFGASHVSLPITFTQDPKQTKMFCPLGDRAMELQQGNFTLNSHSFSIPPETFETDAGLKDMWQVTSTSFDSNHNRTFVASIEGRTYPFMATQFHPEKVTQAWNDNYGINHSWESIELNTFFGRQFLAMARNNKHSFGTFKQTTPYLIDNFQKFETTYYAAELYVFKNSTQQVTENTI